MSEIKHWVVFENSIMVHCRMYSISALATAFVIIFGTISVPFLIQERMKGVDPFQWVTFAWLVAGAFLVGAKSRFSETWPWHDFVRGQILCKSLKQLAKVSGIDSQTILLYLLHNEMTNPVVFQGPYKTIFRENLSISGFSIDEAIKHSTIVAAGFMVLKVIVFDTNYTKYLLFEDIRDEPSNESKKTGKQLVYEIAQEPHSTRPSRMRHRGIDEILKLKKMEISRDHLVLGQYAEESRFG